MKILVLDATTKVLKADLAANPTTNPDYVISYADVDSSTFTEGSADGALTGTTSATLLTGLGSGSKRIVKSISIHNRDSNTITVYLKLDNNGTVRVIEKIVLAAGEAWHNDTQAGGGGTGRPSGSDTQVQFNDGGVFGGNAGLLFDKTTTTLTAANLIVSGGLTVNGTTTNINSTNLVVEDKNIVIGDVTTPTDATANGGGITLLGATNKTITWDSTNSNWTSSEHWNLASAKDFKINNVSVLNATTLGSSVVSSSLTSLGTLASLTVSGSASLATTSGSVGIGTGSPGAKLHVYGSSAVLRIGDFDNSRANTATLAIDTAGPAGNFAQIKFYTGGSATENAAIKNPVSSQALQFFNGTTQAMTLDASGNLLVGATSSGVGKLVSYYTSTAADPLSAANAGLNVWGSVSVRLLFGTDLSSPYAAYIQASNTGTGFPIALNPSGGDVGIGTMSPGSRLDVVKQGNAAGGTLLLSGSKTNNGTKYGYIAGTQYASNAEPEGVSIIGITSTSTANMVNIGGGVDEMNTATSIQFYTASSTTERGSANERMRITSTGSLLLGSTTSCNWRASSAGHITFTTATAATDNAGDSYRGGIGWQSGTSGDAVLSALITAETVATYSANILFLVRNTGGGNFVERARITSTGDLLPGANGTQNFGSSSLRWNTIYTSDLSLSNGIGDWTIVEGEDDLFIYNNKRNRVYKFKLEAVDPSTATPKREV